LQEGIFQFYETWGVYFVHLFSFFVANLSGKVGNFLEVREFFRLESGNPVLVVGIVHHCVPV